MTAADEFVVHHLLDPKPQFPQHTVLTLRTQERGIKQIRLLEFEYLLCNFISCGMLSNYISQAFQVGGDDRSDCMAITGTGDGPPRQNSESISCDLSTSL